MKDTAQRCIFREEVQAVIINFRRVGFNYLQGEKGNNSQGNADRERGGKERTYNFLTKKN